MINNTIKHAEASQVHIVLKRTDNNLVLSYKDDGIGFDETNISYGLGLENMQSRARSIHAQSNIKTAVGQGFSYQLNVQID